MGCGQAQGMHSCTGLEWVVAVHAKPTQQCLITLDRPRDARGNAVGRRRPRAASSGRQLVMALAIRHGREAFNAQSSHANYWGTFQTLPGIKAAGPLKAKLQ